jgi:hypothetical protein
VEHGAWIRERGREAARKQEEGREKMREEKLSSEVAGLDPNARRNP